MSIDFSKPMGPMGISFRSFLRASAISAALVLAGCNYADYAKHQAPITSKMKASMERAGVDKGNKVYVRIFKKEAELELWGQRGDGKYALLETYHICSWSGNLGPKFKEGDRQAPEGFYPIRPAQMNPNSSYHLSFNMGFPNGFDRAHGRTGSHLMVHGACSSRGCYAMEDEQIEEIYSVARESFKGGQREFHVHAFPFRMTPVNMATYSDNEHMPFWQMLKEGYEHFNVTKRVPKVDVCDRRYVFNADAGDSRFVSTAACPAYEVPASIAGPVQAKLTKDAELTAELVAQRIAKQEKAEAKAEKVAARDAEREAKRAERAANGGLVANLLNRGRGNSVDEVAQNTGDVPIPTPAPASLQNVAASPVIQTGTEQAVVAPSNSTPVPRPNPNASVVGEQEIAARSSLLKRFGNPFRRDTPQ